MRISRRSTAFYTSKITQSMRWSYSSREYQITNLYPYYKNRDVANKIKLYEEFVKNILNNNKDELSTVDKKDFFSYMSCGNSFNTELKAVYDFIDVTIPGYTLLTKCTLDEVDKIYKLIKNKPYETLPMICARKTISINSYDLLVGVLEFYCYEYLIKNNIDVEDKIKDITDNIFYTKKSISDNNYDKINESLLAMDTHISILLTTLITAYFVKKYMYNYQYYTDSGQYCFGTYPNRIYFAYDYDYQDFIIFMNIAIEYRRNNFNSALKEIFEKAAKNLKFCKDLPLDFKTCLDLVCIDRASNNGATVSDIIDIIKNNPAVLRVILFGLNTKSYAINDIIHENSECTKNDRQLFFKMMAREFDYYSEKKSNEKIYREFEYIASVYCTSTEDLVNKIADYVQTPKMKAVCVKYIV